ncbi:MAG TPA: hypothetical protein VGO80_10945 [Solirubrobacteraceae bacterium]|nr:hypothetical protein [Solirubrobacteraceae bacterium]
MTKEEKEQRLGAGVLLGVVAAALGAYALIGNHDVPGIVATVLGVIAAALVGSRWEGRTGAAAATGVFLILLAVYLPELGAATLVKDWFGKADAGAVDRADAVAFARWVLVVVGVTLVFWPGRKFALESALVTTVALVTVAAVGASWELADRVSTEDSKETAESDIKRGFAIPADKVQQVAGDLAADTCVKVVLVRATDADTADQGNALTYEKQSYTGRLPATVKAGKPATAVMVELAESQAPDSFATDLTAATSAYLLGC